jgi:hypothetical protein
MQRVTLFYGKINYILWTGFFIHHSTILGVKRVELVSDRMLHIVMRGCRQDLVLIVRAPTANRNDDSKAGFLRGITAGIRSLSYVPLANFVRMF